MKNKITRCIYWLIELCTPLTYFDNNMSFNIGNIKIDPPLILAPMAGITDLPFRLTVKAKGGCGLVYSEMVSANALVRNHNRTRRLLDSDPEEKPLAAQIFGSDPQIMAEAGRIAESMGADILDINMGCPVKKVTKTGAGCALMLSPAEVENDSRPPPHQKPGLFRPFRLGYYRRGQRKSIRPRNRKRRRKRPRRRPQNA
jgi:hypothetical protein